MSSPLSTPSSVTRWLLVVVGCVILEMAQPMIAADAAPAAPAAPVAPAASPALSGDTILYPAGTTAGSAPSAVASSGSSSATWVFIVMSGAMGAGVWYWFRQRRLPATRRGNIQIEDTRPLGNRQFLVVASCDGKRFLLGVAAGGIQMLSPLEDSPDDLDDPA